MHIKLCKFEHFGGDKVGSSLQRQTPSRAGFGIQQTDCTVCALEQAGRERKRDDTGLAEPRAAIPLYFALELQPN
jgi:hypothetical protein